MSVKLNKEQKDIIQAAKEFALKAFSEVMQDFDRNEAFDLDLLRKAAELGFVGVSFDEAYDGIGYSYFEHCLITEEFSAVDAGIGAAVLYPAVVGECIHLFGDESQKQSMLPRITSGEIVPALAVCEPETGTDMFSVATSAMRQNNSWIINGDKIFVIGGDYADYTCVLALTDPENPSPENRHSFILVPRETQGMSCERLEGKLGMRAATAARLSFSNVQVPVSNCIGSPGDGFRQARALQGRIDAMGAAMGVGVARAALHEGVTYSKARHAFGVPISSFQGIQAKLIEMATLMRAARNLYYEAASSLAAGNADYGLAAMAKRFSGKTALLCADEAVQIHGGYGYFDEYRVQRLYRDAKVVDLWEGSKELERQNILKTILG